MAAARRTTRFVADRVVRAVPITLTSESNEDSTGCENRPNRVVAVFARRRPEWGCRLTLMPPGPSELIRATGGLFGLLQGLIGGRCCMQLIGEASRLTATPLL